MKFIFSRFFAAKKQRCTMCGNKIARDYLYRKEVGYEEANLITLVRGYERRYPSTPRRIYWVCNDCIPNFEDIRERVVKALYDESYVRLIYGDSDKSLEENGKRICSAWYKSKEKCEDDLRDIARFYQVDCVYGIECEISEPLQFPDPRSPQILKNNPLLSFEPPEHIYKLRGYISI